MKRLTVFEWRFSSGDFRVEDAQSPRPAAHAAFRISHAAFRRAFSLVEVVLAIGIVSFALVAVIGLMPVGLRSVKNANEQAGAADALNAIADSLRTASSTNAINYSNSFAGTPIGYSVGGSLANNTWNNLTLEGSTNDINRRLAARLDITPPTNSTSPGRATVSVAWSAQANPVWSMNSQTWSNAEGSITSGIQFLPRQ